MADKALFHLRRAHNSLLRFRLSRTFYSSDSEPLKQPTHDQQVAFLQAEDQKYLVQTQNNADTLIAQIRQLNKYIASQKSLKTVQRDPNIPPYILGQQRARVLHDVPRDAQAAIKGLEHIKTHLTDLQYEPYPDRTQDVVPASNRDTKKGGNGQSDSRPWEQVIASMTTGEKEDMLKSMLLEEEATTERLRRDSARLVLMSKEIEGMSRKGKSVDEPVRHGDPFKASDGNRAGGKRAAASAEAGAKREGGKAKEKEKENEGDPEAGAAPVKRKPAMGLGDLQRQLEQSFMKTGG
ncbi:hypothetical protein KC332_g14967 [Hortaea werneckii]|uniref:Uncharacterized protein n=1 Tax=Hortaea werneckii TaxID=91943 RepID=A0A3M7I6D2_HORWE|nr:hypothetical protein KC350_g12295 [Hortaea werneckii]KAI6975835.1 hypothetical protein KC329_g11399 [Hortaea werneckii]KAI7026613.1 hypothetical protein KC366_g11678 [Hortaea werneckii]KAI7058257.1 hypothetical protein KC327_g16033 [Hortaea werneckii]KAI7125219.1 hypothetical protein KC337_g10689 [Hortaea werneckii]